MGSFKFRVPAFLAGSSNTVSPDKKGAFKVAEMIGGVVVGAGVIAGGLSLFDWLRSKSGQEERVRSSGDLLGAE